MATFTMVIPDETAERIANAVCKANNYQPSSLQDAMQFTKNYVFDMFRQIVLDQDTKEAVEAVLNNPDDPLIDMVLS